MYSSILPVPEGISFVSDAWQERHTLQVNMRKSTAQADLHHTSVSKYLSAFAKL